MDDSRGLGRDDPVWPCYVEEATKWDAALIDGWNKSMDVILLFAALFCAIVTAFLIESYQTLKVDNAEVTAMGVIAMLELVQAISMNQPSNSTNITIPSITGFQPTTRAVLINLTWFLSLTLGITVALLAMLVKQWGEGYQSGNGLAPPCVQARIRQARYNKLRSWRTEDIVVSLPVLMHAALGLFLLGLIIFLLDLNQVVFIPVAVVVGITLFFYVATTLLPLFVAFCPYNTPLSSRRLLGFFLQFVTCTWRKSRFMIPCQLEERSRCEDTKPDDLTTQALEWLIQHSRREIMDKAIKAISRADLDIDGWTLLAQGPLISVIAQKFTVACNELSGRGLQTDQVENQHDASVYGRALVKISHHAGLVSDICNGVIGYTTNATVGSQILALDEEQVQAVESGLLQLASSNDRTVSARSIISLSSWYTSTHRSSQTRDKWKTMLKQLIVLISPVNNDENQGQLPTSYPDDDILGGLVQALTVEISHWRWELSRQEMVELLKSLVPLYRTSLLDGPAGAGMSATLSVLALLFNDYQEISPQEADGSQPKDNFLKEAMEAHKQRTEKYIEIYGNFHIHTTKPERAKRRPWRAQSAAILCTTNKDYLHRYSNELLLFGLAGLLDSFAELELGAITDSDPYSVATLVAAQLVRIPIASQSQTSILPWILPATFDIKLYVVDVITRVVSPSPLGDRLGQLNEDDKAALLQYLSERNIWAEFGHQILIPVIKLINCTNIKLLTQCLVALSEYCLGNSIIIDDESEPYPNPIDWMFIFSFKIPHRLVSLVKECGDDGLVLRAISTFHSILEIMPTAANTESHQSYREAMHEVLKSLIRDDLFETFSREIVCRNGYNHFGILREQIAALPGTLDPVTNEDDGQILRRIQEFCRSHQAESGMLATLVVSLTMKVSDMGDSEWCAVLNDLTKSV